MNDEQIYAEKERAREAAHEALCKCCGRCCGAEMSDPCSRLVKQPDGRYLCSAYANRLGPQTTVSGKIFTCVTIRDVHKHDIHYPGCGYDR